MCAHKEYGPEPGGVMKETAAFTLWALEAVRYHLVGYPKVMIVPPFITVARFLKGEIVVEENGLAEVDLNHKGAEKFLLAVTMGFVIEKSEEVGV